MRSLWTLTFILHIQTFLLKYGCMSHCKSLRRTAVQLSFPWDSPPFQEKFQIPELASFLLYRLHRLNLPTFIGFGSLVKRYRAVRTFKLRSSCTIVPPSRIHCALVLAVLGLSLSLSILYHTFYAMSIVFHIKYYTSFVQNFYEKYTLTNTCKSCTIK